MKRIVKDYFSFSKKERAAVIGLLLLIAAFIIAPYFYSVKPNPPVLNKALRDFLVHNKTNSPEGDSESEAPPSFHYPPGSNNITVHKIFPFDPNTVSEEGWKQLGIGDRTIRTILNYRNKGGRFRVPEDLGKIWGMKKEDADKLIPFVRIKDPGPSYTPKANQTGNRKPETGNKTPAIDINTASIDDWKSLPGIGPVLAGRIVRYRDRIGGFTTTEPVQKTYGIGDSVFALISPYLTIHSNTVPKLDLNRVSAYDLRQRTGISDGVARAIVGYRQQYGPYQSVTDLTKIVFMTDSLFQRIAPHVKVE